MSIQRSLAIIFALLAAALCSAETINIGTLSFDNLIPASSTPGVNAFSVGNFTGSFSLDPTFPVLTPIDLLNVELRLSTGSGTSVVQLGSLPPGFSSPAGLQFADTQLFLSATLFADLGSSQFTLADGRTMSVQDPRIIVDLLPMFDVNLLPGLDFSVISVEATDTSSVPEPSSLVTFWALGALVVWKSRFRRGR